MHLTEFAFDLRACTLAPHQIWVCSGRSTVRPLDRTVLGVDGFHAPPFSARDLKLTFSLEADGHPIRDNGPGGKGDSGLPFAGGIWYPDRIVRRGTYHQRPGSHLLSLSVTTELVPLSRLSGFLLVVRVRNRSGRSITLRVVPTLEPGHPSRVPLSEYYFGLPDAGNPAAQMTGVSAWENDAVRV